MDGLHNDVRTPGSVRDKSGKTLVGIALAVLDGPHAGKGARRMDTKDAVDLIRQTLVLAMLISGPMLLIGMVVGIFVSLLQAVTQIQEQTLTFVPKIAAMIVAALILMPWIGQRLLEYAASIFSGGITF
jgi:flagellar biosynthetic protein FliQ